jgi:hypothetical protein
VLVADRRGFLHELAQDLAFLVSAKPSFTIPLNLLSNTVLASKTEVVLDLNPNTASVVAMSKADEAAEDAIARKKRMRTLPDQVVEMRFFIPGSAKSKGLKKKERKVKAKKEEGEDAEMKDGEEKSSDDESEDEDDEEGESAAQAFFEALKERSDMGQEVREALGTISDVLCMTPRGRFGPLLLISVLLRNIQILTRARLQILNYTQNSYDSKERLTIIASLIQPFRRCSYSPNPMKFILSSS